MKLDYIPFFLCLILSFVGVCSFGSTTNEPSIPFSYFIESSKSLTPKEALYKFKNSKDISSANDIIRLGHQSKSVWIHIGKDHLPKITQDSILELGYPLDEVILYIFTEGQLTSSHRGGEFHKKAESNLTDFSRVTIFELPSKSIRKSDLLFKISSQTSMVIPVTIKSINQYAIDTVFELALLGSFFGSILIIASIVGLLAIITRSRELSIYLLYIISYVLFQSGINNALSPFKPEIINSWLRFAPHFAILYAAFMVLLVRDTIVKKSYFPKNREILNIALIISALLFMVAVLLPYYFRFQIALIWVCVIIILVASILISCAHKSADRVRRFMLSWAPVIAGIGVLCLKLAGVAPHSFVTNYAIQFGMLSHIIILGVDIGITYKHNLRKRSEAESNLIKLKQENKINSAIASAVQMVAHDVRKPLTTSKRFMQEIKSSPSKAQEIISNFSEIIERASNEVDLMVDDLLSATQNKALNAKPESIHFLVAETVKKYSINSSEKNVILNVRPKHKNKALIDASKINRVIDNIISNGFDSVNYGGQITLSTSDVHDHGQSYIKVSIHNTGSYIEDSTLQRIFEPFFSMNKAHGTGLGLAIAKKFVTAHKGKIWCESHKTEGTTFYLTMPAAFEKDEFPREELASLEHSNEDADVFVIDDCIFQRWSWNKLNNEYNIETFASPEDFLRFMHSFSLKKSSVIVTDYYFGTNSKYDGSTFVQKLRELGIQNPIFVSSDADIAFDKSVFNGIISKDIDVAIKSLKA